MNQSRDTFAKLAGFFFSVLQQLHIQFIHIFFYIHFNDTFTRTNKILSEYIANLKL